MTSLFMRISLSSNKCWFVIEAESPAGWFWGSLLSALRYVFCLRLLFISK